MRTSATTAMGAASREARADAQGPARASSLRKALDAYGLTVESTSPVPWQTKPAVDMVATWIGGLPEGRRSAAMGHKCFGLTGVGKWS